jgi:CheY-like chemotaxis protein
MRFDVVFFLRAVDAADPFGLAVELRTLLPEERTHLTLVAAQSAPSTETSIFDSFLVAPVRQSSLYDLLVSVHNAVESQLSRPATGGDGRVLAERYPLRVLVAEDNHVNQKVILAHLRRLGYEADAVSNGAEAVQAVGVRSYDVVLMDVHMPELDGLSATRSIRELLGESGPAIIALTADATVPIRSECSAAGMDEYITKPIKSSELTAALVRRATARLNRRAS